MTHGEPPVVPQKWNGNRGRHRLRYRPCRMTGQGGIGRHNALMRHIVRGWKNWCSLRGGGGGEQQWRGRSSTRSPSKIIAAAIALRHVSVSPEESAQPGKEIGSTREIEGISDRYTNSFGKLKNM